VNQEHSPLSHSRYWTAGPRRRHSPGDTGGIAGLLAKSCRRCRTGASRLPAGSSPWVCRPTRTRHDDPLVESGESPVDPSLRRSRLAFAPRVQRLTVAGGRAAASSRATCQQTQPARGVAGVTAGRLRTRPVCSSTPWRGRRKKVRRLLRFVAGVVRGQPGRPSPRSAACAAISTARREESHFAVWKST